MAALGWLLNLGFAGGVAVVPSPGGVQYARLSTKRYGYGYGYRYAEVLRCFLICF